jgi:hypothetical protein
MLHLQAAAHQQIEILSPQHLRANLNDGPVRGRRDHTGNRHQMRSIWNAGELDRNIGRDRPNQARLSIAQNNPWNLIVAISILAGHRPLIRNQNRREQLTRRCVVAF